jgi:hypothetical protein
VGPVVLLVVLSFPGYLLHFQIRPGHSVFSDAGSSFKDIDCHCLFLFLPESCLGEQGYRIYWRKKKLGPPLSGKLIKYEPISFERKKNLEKGQRKINRNKEEKENLNADWAKNGKNGA